MIDSETRRAWRKLRKEFAEDAPIVLRGLVGSGKHIARKLYSGMVRSCKFLIGRARERDLHFGGRRALVAQLSRVRLRSPIYKV